MSDANLIADLVRAGLDPVLLQRVVMELARAQASQEAIEKRRASDAARQANRRNNHVTSRDVTECPVTSQQDEPQKEGPHTPKKNYPLSNSTTSAPARRSKRQKPIGTLCPEDYQPTESHLAKCRAKGAPEGVAFTTCRKMVNWSHGNADKEIAYKADWSRLLHTMLDDEIEKYLRQQTAPRASPAHAPASRNGALSRVANLLGIEDEQPRTPPAERNFGSVIDHEGYGRPDRQIHEQAGGQAGRLSAQNHLRAVGSGWR